MSTIIFPTASRLPFAAKVASPSPEAQLVAQVIADEIDSETYSRQHRRALERRRERITTRITIAACSVAGLAAIGFAQLLLVVR